MMERVIAEPLRQPERFVEETVSLAFLDSELQRVAKKTQELRQRIKNPKEEFPSECPEAGKYPLWENIGWTEGFWTGINWLLAQATGDDSFRETAELADQNFVQRIDQKIITDHHDLGFLYSLSTVAEYRITSNKEMRRASIEAADTLLNRYWEKAGVIQAWGNPNDPTQQGRMIMDCCMNLPLLYWASEETGDAKYQQAAAKHIENAGNYLVREDASTFHTFFMDVTTGKPKYGSTHQGFSDDSCWARGEAWGIYGFMLSYRYLKDKRYFELSKKLTNYFCNRLPADLICQWDLVFATDPASQEPRDTSSMAIAVCGILEMIDSGLLTDEEETMYSHIVSSVMTSLAEHYTTEDSEGFLKAAVYNLPKNNGVDVPCIWGDYFYLEALCRLRGTWNNLW